MKILTATHRLNGGDRGAFNATIPFDRLYPTIKHGWYSQDYARVKEHVEKSGLIYPIVVWETNVREWLKMHNAQPNDILAPPIGMCRNGEYKVLLVMCGNNRLQAAKDLGYDYIDAIVCYEREEVSNQCKRQREAWRLLQQGKSQKEQTQ